MKTYVVFEPENAETRDAQAAGARVLVAAKIASDAEARRGIAEIARAAKHEMHQRVLPARRDVGIAREIDVAGEMRAGPGDIGLHHGSGG